MTSSDRPGPVDLSYTGRRTSSGVDRRTVLQGIGGITVLGAVAGTGKAANAQQAAVEWSFEAAGFVESSPTIVDGVIYFGDEEGIVYAVDIDDQETIWSFQTGGQIRSDAQVVDGSVYIGSVDQSVYAIDAETGTQEWRFPTDSHVNAAPTRVGDTVYVGSEDNNVYAIDAETGTENWHYTTGDLVTNAPTVVDGTVYIGSRDETVYALDADDGSLEWQHNTGLWINSEVTVHDGVAYVGGDDSTLYAFDADDGNVQWEFSEPVAHLISATTYHDGVVYVASDGETYGRADNPTDAVLYAVDAETGQKEWEFAVPVPNDTSEDWHFHAAPTVADGVVYISNTNGTIYGLDATAGEEVWRFETGDAVWSSPTVVDGTVYVGSDDHSLYALEAVGDGSSADTRVQLGTLGHHDEWGSGDDPETDDPADEQRFDLTMTSYHEVRSNVVLTYTLDVTHDGDESVRDVPVTFELFDDVHLEDSIGELAPGDQETFVVHPKTTGVEPGEYEVVVTIGETEHTDTVTVVSDDDPEAIRMTRDVLAEEVVVHFTGDTLFQSPPREIAYDIIDGAEIWPGDSVWESHFGGALEAGAGELSGSPLLEYGTVFYPGGTWEEVSLSTLEEQLTDEDIFPGDHWFPGDTFLDSDVQAVDGRSLEAALDAGVPEREVIALLEHGQVLISGEMLDLEDTADQEVISGSGVYVQADAFYPGGTWEPDDVLFSGDTFFPGDHWFPGDMFDDGTWFPGDMFEGDESWFPGDMFHGDTSVQPGDTRIFGTEMGFLQGTVGMEDHSDVLGGAEPAPESIPSSSTEVGLDDHRSLLTRGGMMLPAGSWEAVHEVIDEPPEAGDDEPAEADEDEERTEAEPTADDDEGSEDGDDEVTEDATADTGDDLTGDDGSPGFGIPGALAALLGSGYALRRLAQSDSEDHPADSSE